MNLFLYSMSKEYYTLTGISLSVTYTMPLADNMDYNGHGSYYSPGNSFRALAH